MVSEEETNFKKKLEQCKNRKERRILQQYEQRMMRMKITHPKIYQKKRQEEKDKEGNSNDQSKMPM